MARVVQAVGAALLTPASLSLVLAAFPLGKRAVVVSLWGAVGGLAAATGPSLGALVIDSLGWQWMFYLNAPLGFYAIWRGSMMLRESKQPSQNRPLDLVGMSLLMAGIGALALCIVQGKSPGWSRRELLGITAFGLTCILGFIAWAKVAAAPLVNLTLFRNTTYRYANLATLSFGTAFSMMFFAFFFYMNSIWHYPLPLAGLAMAPGPLVVVPVAAFSGRFASRHGHRPLLVIGSLIYAASALWFLKVPGTEPAYLTHWLPGMLFSGIGIGMAMPSLSGAAVSYLPSDHYAVGAATLATPVRRSRGTFRRQALHLCHKPVLRFAQAVDLKEVLMQVRFLHRCRDMDADRSYCADGPMQKNHTDTVRILWGDNS